MPGAHDALTARLARRAGFECLYLSGAALSASMALPDLGIIAQDELVHASRMISRAAGLPLIVDGDTGYGEALNVMRLVAELEQSGAAAVQLEDQQLPKKCGHLNDKRLVPAEEMARKIDAARRARSDLVIVARTDAAAVGLEEAIRRARLYVEAGADVIFPEALSSDDDFRTVADAVAGADPRQHDGVRTHALSQRRRFRKAGLQAGHLAGFVTAGGGEGGRGTLCAPRRNGGDAQPARTNADARRTL